MLWNQIIFLVRSISMNRMYIHRTVISYLSQYKCYLQHNCDIFGYFIKWTSTKKFKKKLTSAWQFLNENLKAKEKIKTIPQMSRLIYLEVPSFLVKKKNKRKSTFRLVLFERTKMSIEKKIVKGKKKNVFRKIQLFPFTRIWTRSTAIITTTTFSIVWWGWSTTIIISIFLVIRTCWTTFINAWCWFMWT